MNAVALALWRGPAPGRNHTVNNVGHDGAELDFHHDSGRTLRVEVELEDGRLKVRTE